jgi:hypothetical protein
VIRNSHYGFPLIRVQHHARKRYNTTLMPQRKPSAGGEEQQANVRHLDGVGWQVLVASSSQWHTCRREQDACFLASGLRIAGSVMRGELFGKEVAEELDAVARVAVRSLRQEDVEWILSAAELARSRMAT